MTKKTWSVLCAATFMLLLVGAEGKCDMPSLEIGPLQPAFVLGEPIQLVMTFGNSGKDTAEVDLGVSGTENVELSVSKKGGEKRVVSGTSGSGFAAVEIVRIASGKSESRTLILDDLIVLTEVGKYQIVARVGEGKKLEARTEVHVVPTVQQTCAKLWDDCSEEKGKIRNVRSLKLLCLTRHKDALAYQYRLLEKGADIGTGNLNALLKSMLSTRVPEVIAHLVKTVLSKGKQDSSVRPVVLYHLQSVLGDGKWEKKCIDLLAPYRKEIEKAAPVGVSD